MPKPKQPNTHADPGYEPAKGHVGPSDEARAVPVTGGPPTHYPSTNGPVCGKRPTPTKASSYDAVAPTCPVCAKWLASAQRTTGAILAQQAAGDAKLKSQTPAEE